MPCAAGKLCQIPEKTPEPSDGHGCYRGCGGRLHGICGEVEREGDSELRRICPKCASKQPAKAASTAAAGKRKAQDAGATQKRTKAWPGKQQLRSAPRTRLTVEQKVVVLAELDKGVTQETVADRFKCGVRTVPKIKKNRRAIESQTQTAKGNRKSNRRGNFPEVRSCC